MGEEKKREERGEEEEEKNRKEGEEEGGRGEGEERGSREEEEERGEDKGKDKGKSTNEEDGEMEPRPGELMSDDEIQALPLHELLVAFYEKYNPSKLDEDEMVAERMAGKEDKVWALLCKKYASEMTEEKMIGDLL